ncbi:MAG: glycosyltransferase, partial [Gemmatimonadetes bacterium]|nr:glycosyltransferase [Gemmatimonadota bacterium]
VCLKGDLPRLPETVAALRQQEYVGPYRVSFVTEATSEDGEDAACQLAPLLVEGDHLEHVVSGRVVAAGERCAQKNWNLLQGMRTARERHGAPEVWAFCDGDLVVQSNWLAEMVRPIVAGESEASTTFHYLEPSGSRVLHALHGVAETCQSLASLVVRGAAWGGSMAIRADAFERLGLERVWRRTVVDDMTLSRVLANSRLRVAAVPRFLVNGRSEIDSWRGFVKWLGRQYFFVKVYLPTHYRILWTKTCLDVATIWLGTFHVAHRLWRGTWFQDPLAAAVAIGSAVAIVSGISLFRYLLPARPPIHSWMGASLLAPGISLLACADSTLRRRKLQWRDLTYIVDRQGTVAHVVHQGVVVPEEVGVPVEEAAV